MKAAEVSLRTQLAHAGLWPASVLQAISSGFLLHAFKSVKVNLDEMSFLLPTKALASPGCQTYAFNTRIVWMHLLPLLLQNGHKGHVCFAEVLNGQSQNQRLFQHHSHSPYGCAKSAWLRSLPQVRQAPRPLSTMVLRLAKD